MKRLRLLAGIVCTAACCVAIAAPEDSVCPKEDEAFQPFLKRFSEDPPFRTARVIFPLAVRVGDVRFNPSSIEVWGKSTVEALNYPLMLAQAKLTKSGIVRAITVSTKSYVEVYDQSAEGDTYRKRYSFRKVHTCWFLEALHDASL